MTVTPEDKEAMVKILSLFDGSGTPQLSKFSQPTRTEVELAGPGQVTGSDVNAMSQVLQKFYSASNTVVKQMVLEGQTEPHSQEILETQRTTTGVKVGKFQILIKEDQKRIAGKQYYQIYNSLTNDVIADEISLYETALSVVRHLNSGKYSNHKDVRELFDLDDSYTSHKIDAIRYKRKIKNNTDEFKQDLYESRYQASLDRCMQAKKAIKSKSI